MHLYLSPKPIVDLFGLVASTFFKGSDDTPNTTFDIAGYETSIIDQVQVSHGNSPYLSIVLEIILALERLVDSEMMHGSGCELCATEWESFVRAIDIGISPWLAYGVRGGDIVEEILVETYTIFAQLTSFLGKCSQVETGFHEIVDDDARNYVHTFLLRKIAPLIQMGNSFPNPISYPMVGDDATTLALTVIKSWTVIRYLPFKKGDWAKRAKTLLAEAFAIPNSRPAEDNRYVGGYLHHPTVRLEALRSLVEDDTTDIIDSSIKDSDSVSSSGISTMTPVSLKSSSTPPAFSLFSREY